MLADDPMDITAVRTLISEARQCAVAMLDNGTFIQGELPGVRMDDATRLAAKAVCSALIGTKHDIIHELFELDELLRGRATNDRIASIVDGIIRWLRDTIQQMVDLIQRLETMADTQPDTSIAFTLFAESAVNIIKPFNRAEAAAKLLFDSDSIGP